MKSSRLPRIGADAYSDEPWILPPWARRVVARLVGVVCPPHTDAIDVQHMTADHRLIDDIEAAMSALGHGLRMGLLAGLQAYHLGAVLRFGRRADRLDGVKTRRYFETWLAVPGPMHEFAQGIKGLICMAYYELPEIKDALDYHPGDWIAEVDARRQASYAEDVRRHQESICAPDPMPGRDLVSVTRLVRSLPRTATIERISTKKERRR